MRALLVCLLLAGCASPTEPVVECVFYVTPGTAETTWLFLPTDRMVACGTLTLEVRP